MTEVTNRNEVRDAIAAGGWIIAWGDLINEADAIELIVFASIGAAGNWVSEQINAQLRKFNQSLTDVSEDVVNQAIGYLKGLLQQKRSGEREIDGLGVKAGIATYHRHFEIPFNGKVSLPNNHQPYIGVRVTKPLPGKAITPVGRNLGPRVLLQNATMSEGDYLQSENSLYRFILQGDGNVVLYTRNNEVVWHSDTDGRGTPPYRIVAQDDGNVVQYDSSGQALWRTGTRGLGGHVLTLQNDRNLVIYDNGNKAVWESHTRIGRNLGPRILLQNATMSEGDYLQSENSLYRFILQGDGNVVLYTRNNEVVWHSDTDGRGTPPYRIVAQDDGNVVQYDSSGQALWRTGTRGLGGHVLTLQNDRNLVIYDNGNKAVWESRTYPGAK